MLNNIVISGIANRMYPYIKGIKDSRISREESKNIFKDIKALSISKIAGTVANGTDNIIISKLFGLSSVGLVSNYTLIINSINSLLWSSISSVTASVGNLNAEENSINKIKIFDQLFLVTYWVYSFACIGLMVLLNPFIIIWIGENFIIDNLTIFSLVWIVYVSGINYPAFVFRTTMGYFNQVKNVYICSAFINLVLSIVMGKLMGLAGVFLATSISRLVSTEVSDGIYVFKYGFSISPLKYFKKYYLYFALFLINYFITNYFVNLIPYSNIKGFILKLLICIILPNAIMFVIFLKSDAYIELVKKFMILSKKIFNKKTCGGKVNV